MREKEKLRIQIMDTRGTSLAVQFDHIDVGVDEWIGVFKLILKFLTFDDETIKEQFIEEE